MLFSPFPLSLRERERERERERGIDGVRGWMTHSDIYKNTYIHKHSRHYSGIELHAEELSRTFSVAVKVCDSCWWSSSLLFILVSKQEFAGKKKNKIVEFIWDIVVSFVHISHIVHKVSYKMLQISNIIHKVF